MRNRIGPHFALCGAALPLLVAATPPAAGEVRLERRLAAMGTELTLELAGPDRAALLTASEAALAALAAAEARLSTWSEAGELSRLNRQPVGVPVPLSGDLAAELAAAWGCREATDGGFDPALAPLVAAWGLRAGGRVPDARERAAARAASGPGGFRLGPGPVAMRLHPGAGIEEGGFGKGAGLDRAAAALAGRVAWGRLDLGGQVVLVGAGRPVPLAVADPRDRGRPAVEVALVRGSLATSGNSERAAEVAGRRLGHLLDPRTGEPAPDFGSVTVWAADALAADCLSTGLFVLGPEAALAFAGRRPEVGVLVLEPAGAGVRARVAGALAGRVRPARPGVFVETWPGTAGVARSPSSSRPPVGRAPARTTAGLSLEGASR